MELEAEHKFPVRKVPCASGSRLHFSWGTGHCLNLVDCCARSNLATHTGIQSAQHVATTLRWYFPSETMRRVSCDVQPHHEGLQQKRYSGAIVEGSAEWAEEVERYSRTISSVMGRDNDVREPPLQLNREMLEAGKFPEEDPFVPWQRALWELLEVFFIDKGSARVGLPQPGHHPLWDSAGRWRDPTGPPLPHLSFQDSPGMDTLSLSSPLPAGCSGKGCMDWCALSSCPLPSSISRPLLLLPATNPPQRGALTASWFSPGSSLLPYPARALQGCAPCPRCLSPPCYPARDPKQRPPCSILQNPAASAPSPPRAAARSPSAAQHR
uniref:Uncharacterized protein n=1 Tax=Tetraselmis sp. GSL018 TaxID=582737 RepID=A0A061SDE7_9CHLO